MSAYHNLSITWGENLKQPSVRLVCGHVCEWYSRFINWCKTRPIVSARIPHPLPDKDNLKKVAFILAPGLREFGPQWQWDCSMTDQRVRKDQKAKGPATFFMSSSLPLLYCRYMPPQTKGWQDGPSLWFTLWKSPHRNTLECTTVSWVVFKTSEADNED